jgi:hypothetical protein
MYMVALFFTVQNNVQVTTCAILIARLFYYDAVGPQLTERCLVMLTLAQVISAVIAL